MDITIVAGSKTYKTSVMGFSFIIDSTVSIKYDFIVSLTDADKSVFSLLEENDQVKILAGSSLICEGDITNIDVRTMNDVIVVKASFQDHAFKRLQTTKVEDVVLNGDPIREIVNLISSKGFKTSMDITRQENVKYVANGYLYNILRRAARERGIIWNVSRGTVFVGNVLSSKSHYLKSQDAVSFFTSFLNTDGVMYKKHDISINFNSEIRCGDKVIMGNKTYIVGRVSHRFVYEGRKEVLVKSTNIFCFEKIENVYWYAEAMDTPSNEMDDLLDDRMVKEKYDVDGSRVAYKDLERKLWVGDNEKVVFAMALVGPGQMYLNLGGVACSAFIGAYLPYECVITDVRMTISAVDISYIEIMRNGVVVERFYCNALLKHEKLNLETGPGIFSARYTPGVGAAGIASVVFEMNYRKVLKT